MGNWRTDLTTTALESHELPAEGFVDYRYAILPYVFLQDTWISAAEILPSNPAVVHHCNMAFVTLGKSFSDGNFITGRVPGGTAMTLDDGVAVRNSRRFRDCPANPLHHDGQAGEEPHVGRLSLSPRCRSPRAASFAGDDLAV
jgi:hypothetical protein